MVARLPGEGPPFSGKDPAVLLYAEVRSRITSRDFATWFAETPCSFQAPDRFILTAPNRFRKAWMQKNYGELLRSCARFIFEHEVHIDFLVRDLQPPAGAGTETAPRRPSDATMLQDAPARPTIPVQGTLQTPLGAPSSRGSRPPKPAPERPKLKKEFTFENFVVGPSTRVAHAAARAVSDAPAKAYNPLFLYGEPGVGKTHLLQAVCHRILATTRLRVGYVSSSDIQFTEDGPPRPVSSGLPSHWKEADVLVIDDLQFLPNKESLQNRLFHTVNTLLEANKQILLASRSHPRSTENIPERLASRFQWGLVAQLQSPSFNTRVDILLRKAHLRGCELPLEVAEFLADRIRDNPRALEGALVQALTFTHIHRAPLDLATARLALENLSDACRPTGITTIAQILQAVQEYYQIRPKDLLSRSKIRSLVYARQMGMYLARQLTSMSLQEIGMHFGGRDHTTVLYSTARIEKMLKSERTTRADFNTLKNRIGSSRL
jgi:chromosomal replication initiator protein